MRLSKDFTANSREDLTLILKAADYYRIETRIFNGVGYIRF